MNTLVTLARYEKVETAYFLKDKLENENIECFFTFSHSLEVKSEEICIQVKANEVEKAIQIMLRIKDEYGKDIKDLSLKISTHRILVPTGFSKGSENACYFAIHLAEKINAEIKLIHVYENPVTDINIKETATYLEYLDSAVKEAERHAKAEILSFTEKMKKYILENKINKVNIHSCIVKGNTVDRIKRISEKYNPNVIVLGTQGKKDDPESILTRLANEVVHKLEAPLFAIPGNISPNLFKKANILYATDFNDRDHNSLEHLLKITDTFEKKITCIHIDTAHNEAKEERIDELNIQLKKDYSGQDIKCQLIDSVDVFQGMKDFAENMDCNLLSFTVRKKSIFDKLFKPNLFKKILQEANMPVLIFPS